MSWLDKMISGVQSVFVGGVAKPTEPIVNLVAGVGIALSSADDPSDGMQTITITASGGATARNARILGAGSYTLNPGDSCWCTGTVALSAAPFASGQSADVTVVTAGTVTIYAYGAGQIVELATPSAPPGPATLTVPGQSITVESPDGTNLYY